MTTAAVVAALVSMAMPTVLAWSASGTAAAVVPNPPAQATVGLDVAVVIDASSSLGDVGMQYTKDAVDRLLLPLVDTGSWVSVTSFAQGSPGEGGTNVAPTLLTNQALPAVRAGYTDLRAAGGTSWQAGLAAAEASFAGFGQGRPDLLLFVTDGAPNTVDGVFLPPASTRPLDAAVAVADRIKAGGTRIFGVAVRTADIPIEAISGDVAYAGSDVGSADFARIDAFAEMPAAFAGYAADLVAPSVTVSVVHSGADGSLGPLPAWTVDATVTIAGQDGSWILPPGPPALRAGIPSLRRASTQDEGVVAVQWRPQSEATSSLVLVPRTQPPLGSEELLACTVRDAASGSARSVDASLGPDGWRLGTVGSAEVVTCTARTLVEAIPTPEPIPSPSAAPPLPPPPLPEPGRSPRPPARTTSEPAAPPSQTPAATPTPTASPTASATPSPSPAPSSSPDPSPAGPGPQAADGMPRTAFDPGPAPPPVTAGPLAVFDPAAQVRVTLDVVPGQVVGGQSVSTEASSLEPFSLVYGTVYSSPQRLFFEVADSSGTYQSSAGLPENLGAGPHVVIVEATSITGRTLSVAGGFALDDEGKVVAVAQPRALVEPTPADPRVLRALQYGRPAHDARADTLSTATAGVAAAVALGIGAAGAGSTVVRGKRKGSVKGLITKRIREVETVEPGPGDRSRTWRWPGTAWTDRFVRVLPTVGATRTSVIARLGQEGTWARVVLGSGGYLLWAVAAGLALLSSAEQQGLVVTPQTPVLLALVVIGVLDASAGTIGWAVLVATSLVSGNIATADDVRTLLGIGSLLVWPVLLSNAIRPLRRPDWWTDQSGRVERLIDYVVPPVLVAFLAGGAAKALNGLSGLELVTDDDVAAMRWAVGIAVVVRYLLEDVAARLYPQRTRQLAAGDIPAPTRPWYLGGVVVRFALFLFVAEPFFGVTGASVVAGFLSVLPALGMPWQDRLPNSPNLYHWLPRGMLKTLLAIVVSAIMARVFIGDGGDDAIRSTMVLMTLPGLVVAIIELFGRSGAGWPTTIWKRIGGALVWVAIVALTTGVVALFA